MQHSASKDSAQHQERESYDPARIEPKWQAFWERDATFRTPALQAGERGTYILDMFPYPSAAGLHVGHPLSYTATDIVARFSRARGEKVLHPMGFDAFGLPAEQHAIKTGTHPRDTTKSNIENFRRQLKMLGFSYDWEREVDTTDPKYVRWTQWIFLQLFQRGLAYQDSRTVNWCPALGTVLANEEVIDGKSERGNHPVERRPLRQWVLKITAYADRLLSGLKDVEWPSSTRTMQEEWIGRSEGARVRFGVEGHDETIEVYTTRPDTLFGATFMVLAPEHPLVEAITSADQRDAVSEYVQQAKNRSDLVRQQSKEKTGVFTGGYAINPLNQRKVPVWIADYVLMGYGTGAIMAVPAHDVRDFEFAQKYALPIVQVVAKQDPKQEGAAAQEEAAAEVLTQAMPAEGVAIASGPYDGMRTAEAKRAITEALIASGQGSREVQYKLRDWVFSRQRYWGEPFPIYFPVKGDPRVGEEGVDFEVDYSQPIAVEESELPITLPEMDDFQPGDDPRGVLARAKEWRFFQKDGAWFARETNTMPQWAGSCWYYLRYCDPHNEEAAFDAKAAEGWLPVDLYIGGAEHAVLHLLYARFWHMVLYDEGYIGTPEPFVKLVHQGMILGEVEYLDADGKAYPAAEVSKREGEFVWSADPSIHLEAKASKMSKSLGNVVNPDEIVAAYGADALRVYEMFMGPLKASKPWSTESIGGVYRFLSRCYRLAQGLQDQAERPMSEATAKSVHRCIDKVQSDIQALRLNTAISAMMVLSSELAKEEAPAREAVAILAQLLHPFAPHLAEEMWSLAGREPSIQKAPWPAVDPALLVDEEIEIPVQIMGKKRAAMMLSPDADEATALARAKEQPKIAEALANGNLVKVIWVQGKILNLIIR